MIDDPPVDSVASTDLTDTFPALADVTGPDLRAGITDAGALALADSAWDHLDSIPWLPDEQERLGLPDETLGSPNSGVGLKGAGFCARAARCGPRSHSLRSCSLWSLLRRASRRRRWLSRSSP